MIIPIRALTIEQICERKDDLLVSNNDIHKLGKHVKEQAIDEFITAYKNYCENTYGDVAEQEICDMEAVAEQLKGGADNV